MMTGTDAQLLLTRILTSVTNCIQIVQLINAISPPSRQRTIERVEKTIAASVRFIVYAPLLRSLTTAEFNDRR